VDTRLRRLLAGAAIAAAGISLASAQTSPQTGGQNGGQNVGPIILPPTTQAPIVLPGNAAAPEPANIQTEAPPPPPRKPVAVVPPPPQIPAGPPPAARSPTAILHVLDKVTAETMRFAAPVGRRVRYKSLIFIVKTCETRGLSDPLPRPSAYLVVDFEPQALPGRAPPAARQLFRGWMFANSPGLHPFEHPVYDAWLEACTQATP
jgi:hypothetical protein